ncbi:Oxidoreductase, short chain dehydrogenase/reductase family [Candidatus Burkholderia verschuerenii]|uniref:Oxidoreductase, short chain dehydrogenase/reductase family n=1 Tax=Candidatus Burkholderia verschuerenii TaxID=242163 RepID=A0A0L0MDJ7_9BURK|nr:SDR family oxidoreductase [Candidatus Burkholderia verschuerenii]KND60772.1 Oxidoreductase, short chain dehydrogenase/reductase family [Candidatus Burkholderia verschuerenii]
MNHDDPFSLKDKRILVTGASSGIGREVAIMCAQMGAQLVLTGRDVARLDATAGELHGDCHSLVAADLSDADGIDRVVAEAGVVDGVVHAAGISRLAPFRMISKSHVDEIFDSNTYAPLLLTKGLLSKKKIAQNGSILFISAVASHIGPLASTAYSSSKAALLGAMRSLALEVAKQGIRANCIVPGYVRTPMLDGLGGADGNLAEHIALAPLGLGEPQDVAAAAVFYLADASRWITRNYFIVDAGLTVGMDIYA